MTDKGGTDKVGWKKKETIISTIHLINIRKNGIRITSEPNNSE